MKGDLVRSKRSFVVAGRQGARSIMEIEEKVSRLRVSTQTLANHLNKQYVNERKEDEEKPTRKTRRKERK